jgi:hypothetical protein
MVAKLPKFHVMYMVGVPSPGSTTCSHVWCRVLPYSVLTYAVVCDALMALGPYGSASAHCEPEVTAKMSMPAVDGGAGVGETVVGEGVAGVPLQMAKPVRVTEPSVRHEMVEPAVTRTPVGAVVPW